MRRPRYSELECFVLGVIWQLGPCSPYDIRRHLAASPSTQWSASAGAIYPLVKKLEQRKLLRARDQATGKRPRRMYVITPAGRRVLQAWVGPPLASEAISVAYDPLRTRARFLGVASAAQRQAWVKAAEAALAEVERRVQEWQSSYGGDDPFLRLMTRTGELDVQSRRVWLREVGAAVNRGEWTPQSGGSADNRPSPGRGG